MLPQKFEIFYKNQLNFLLEVINNSEIKYEINKAQPGSRNLKK